MRLALPRQITYRKEGITVAKKATEHPSTMFGVAGRAFHDLEKEGVNTRRFLQLIVDKPDFRQLIVDAYKDATERPQGPIINLPEGKIPEGPAGHLAVALFGSSYDNEKYDKYVYYNGLGRLLDELNTRERGIIILRFGLDGSEPATRTRLGQTFQVSTSRIRQIEENALSKMRTGAYREEWSDPRNVLSLRLSERPRILLLQARIRTVDQLREMTEDDLLSITNFGMKCLDEVKAKLAERGLKLKDA